jgi:hypothetical protein
MIDILRPTTSPSTTDRKGKKRADPPLADEAVAAIPSPGKKAKRNIKQSPKESDVEKASPKDPKGKQPVRKMPRRPAYAH